MSSPIEIGLNPICVIWTGVVGDSSTFSVTYEEADLTGVFVKCQFRKKGELLLELDSTNRITVTVTPLVPAIGANPAIPPQTDILFALTGTETRLLGLRSDFDIQLQFVGNVIQTHFQGTTQFTQDVTR